MIQRLPINTGELPGPGSRTSKGSSKPFDHDIFCEVVSAGAESLYPLQEKCSYVHLARDNGARLHPAEDARPMRVLIVSAAYPPMRAGEATNTFHLATRLADRGHQVTVLTSVSNTVPPGVGVNVQAVMPHWGWSALPRFAASLRHIAPDAILLMYIGWIYDSHPMVTFAPTVARKLLPSVPFVTRFENTSASLPGATPLLARVARHAAARCAGTRNVDYNYGTLLRDSRALIVLSDHHRAALARHNAGVEEKTTLIPPPPNMPIVRDDGEVRKLTREALGVCPGEFLLAYLGYVYPGKGIDTLLHAVHKLAKQAVGVRLVIIGGRLQLNDLDASDYFEDTQHLARHLGIADRVTWTGEYAHDDQTPSRYLRAADACVLPFDTGIQLNNSSFSSAVAHELPVITTCGVRLEQQFAHGDNIFISRPKDPAALAHAIGTVMRDDELRDRLRAGARRFASEWFSWERALDRTVEVLGSRPATDHER